MPVISIYPAGLIDPNNHIGIESRIHRIGQNHGVVVDAAVAESTPAGVFNRVANHGGQSSQFTQ